MCVSPSKNKMPNSTFQKPRCGCWPAQAICHCLYLSHTFFFGHIMGISNGVALFCSSKFQLVVPHHYYFCTYINFLHYFFHVIMWKGWNFYYARLLFLLIWLTFHGIHVNPFFLFQSLIHWHSCMELFWFDTHWLQTRNLYTKDLYDATFGENRYIWLYSVFIVYWHWNVSIIIIRIYCFDLIF